MKKIILKIKEKYLPEKKYRAARIWSNEELQKIAPLFSGNIINVSAWEDSDKRGRKYEDYFINKNSYTISNYVGQRGLQGVRDEIELDLEKDLPQELFEKYDVVFNHTTLEHIFDVQKAFSNLCHMSKDIVIIVVPFLQEMHYNQGFKDYWRFTPFAVKKLFERNNFQLSYIAANNSKNESIYVFAVGTKNYEKWKEFLAINEKIFSELGNKIIN